MRLRETKGQSTVGTWRSEDLGPGLFDVKAHTPSTTSAPSWSKIISGVCTAPATAMQGCRGLSPEGGHSPPDHHSGAPACSGLTELLKVGASEPTVSAPHLWTIQMGCWQTNSLLSLVGASAGGGTRHSLEEALPAPVGLGCVTSGDSLSFSVP